MRGRCTRAQAHPQVWFRWPWIFGLLSLKHRTRPYCASVFWYTEVNFYCQMQQIKILKAISQKQQNGFWFLNDENLGKCLGKHWIRLITPTPWLSSPHWAKSMTNSYPLRSPSKRRAKTLALIRRRPVTRVYLNLGISQNVEQSEKFLDPCTVTRPTSNLYARVNCSVKRAGTLAWKGTRETCFDDKGLSGFRRQSTTPDLTTQA